MIELREVRKFARDDLVLAVDRLTVEGGEIAGVVGPVGRWRTALVDLLLGRQEPSSGSVRVACLEPSREARRLGAVVGLLLAENAHYDRMTARGNLEFHCRLRGLPPGEATSALRRVGLADRAGLLAKALTTGEARRLALARATLHSPSTLIAVEPFAGCDPGSIALLVRVLEGVAESGSAVLLVAGEAGPIVGLAKSLYLVDGERVIPAPTAGRQAELPLRIPARAEGEVTLLNPADVLYVSAEEGRVRIHGRSAVLPSHFTLAELEERLGRSGFFRAHRAYLVNLQHVRSIVPYTRDSFTLVLDDEGSTEIPLSKTAARELRDLLGY